MPHTVTEIELADLIRPFIRARFRRIPDPASRYGGLLPRTAAIDILHRSHSVDADVRAVTADGVEIFSYDRCEMIAWSAIHRVTIAGLDADGARTRATIYVPEREAEFDRITTAHRLFARTERRAAA